MKKVSSLLIATCLTASTAALADHQMIGSFEDMRAACQNPAKFHNQVAPTNIQVSCKDVQTKWVPDAGTAQPLDTMRTITVQVNSDKYSSNAESAALPTDPQMVGCPAYKQIVQTVETVRAVSCQELLSFQGSAADFCDAAVTSLVKANPEAINTEATGRTFNMCGVAAPTAQTGQTAQVGKGEILPPAPMPSKGEQTAQVELVKEKHHHHFHLFRRK